MKKTESTVTAATESTSKRLSWINAVSRLRLLTILIIIGVMSGVITVFHGNPPETVPVTFAYDSYFFRETTALLLDIFQQTMNFCQHRSCDSVTLVRALSLLPLHMRHDGPILPVVFASICQFFNQSFTDTDWPLIIEIQSTIHAATVVLVGVLCYRLTQNRGSAIVASCLYALYPPAVLATGRLLSETLANFIICIFLLVLSSRPTHEHKALPLVAGILAGVLFMLKSALVTSIAPALLFYLFIRKRSWWAWLLVPLGGSLVVMPWYFFSGIFLHQASFVPDRGGAMNLAVGLDLETGGVPTIFASPFVKTCFDYAHPADGVFGLLRSHPWEYLRLFLWKSESMFIYPWNDFMHTFVGLNYGAQFILHQGFMFTAMLGMVILCSQLPRFQRQRDAAPFIYLGFLSGHAVWILFITCSRYPLTAMPLLAICASLPLLALRWLKPGQLKNCCAIWAALLIFGGITYKSSPYNLNEQRIALWNGSSILRQVTLPADKKPLALNTALLLVDADELSTDTRVIVNGKPISGALSPFYNFDESEYSFITTDEIGTATKRANMPKWESARLWRAISVPAGLLRFGAANTIEIQQRGGKATIYADRVGSSKGIPCFIAFSDELFYLDPARADGRPRSSLQLRQRQPGEKWYYVDSNGARREETSLTPRVKLMFVNAVNSGNANDSPPDSSKITMKQVAAEDIDMLLTQVFRVSSMHPELDVPVVPVPIRGSAIYEVTGLARSLERSSNPSISVLVKCKSGRSLLCPLEKHFQCTRKWKPFRIFGTVKMPVTEQLSSVVIILQSMDLNRLRPGEAIHPDPSEFWNLTLKVTPVNIPQCDLKRMAIY